MKLWAIVNNCDCEEHGVAGIYTTLEKAKKAYIENVYDDNTVMTYSEAKKAYSQDSYYDFIVCESHSSSKEIIPDDNAYIYNIGCSGKKEYYNLFDPMNDNVYNGYYGYDIIEINTDTWFDEWL